MVRISEAIKDDHRKLESCYNIIVNSEDEDERTRFQNQFTWELARHSVAEELVLFPAMEKLRSDGKEKLDDDRREHSAVSVQTFNREGGANYAIAQRTALRFPRPKLVRSTLHPYNYDDDGRSGPSYARRRDKRPGYIGGIPHL